jgi:ribosomal protein L37AE/L43A
VEAYPSSESAVPPLAAAAAVAGAQSVPDTESATGESTQCPRCGTENRPGLAFCRNCGQRLVAVGVAPTIERPGTPEGTMACPRCGTHNRTGVAFCQNCGANLRGTAPGYVPPTVAGVGEAVAAAVERRGAVLGPVVLLIGMVGLITGYLLPFLVDVSLFDRAAGAGGYGIAFWSGYSDVAAGLENQAYFGLAAPVPLFALVLVVLAIAGFVRAAPGMLQTIGLVISLVWSVGLIVLFGLVEVGGNWGGDVVGVLRELTPAGIIFFLASLIVLIGTLTRFGRS